MKLSIKYDATFELPGAVILRATSHGTSTIGEVELTTKQAQAIVAVLADQLGLVVSKQPANDVDPAFLTSCPTGYETLVGYMVRQGIDIDPTYGARAGRELTQYARIRRADVLQVEAPQALHEDHTGMRIEKVNAYPSWLLDAFFRGATVPGKVIRRYRRAS